MSLSAGDWELQKDRDPVPYLPLSLSHFFFTSMQHNSMFIPEKSQSEINSSVIACGKQGSGRRWGCGHRCCPVSNTSVNRSYLQR